MFWKKSISRFILFIIVVAAVNGTTVSASGKEELVLDTEKIDDFVRSEMKAGDIPGLAIAIVQGDKMLYLKGYGRARADGTPVTPQTPFILGSISKGLTGLAVMRLVDRGEIDIDVPIKKYLPYFRPKDTKVTETVTVRQLLNHTSGISNYSGSKLRKPEEPLEEFLREQVNLKLQHPAGENFEYSSLNYDILGAVIETVSGKSYKDFIKEEVFIPLEMDQSYANIKEGVEGGLADGYRNLFGLEFPGKTKVVESMIPSSYLMSGAEDMSHYLMTILNEGKYRDHRILSKDNAERLIKPLSNNSPYGVGWYYSGSYSWHTGEEPDYNGYMKVIPSGKLGIVMLCNTNDIVGKALAKDSSSTRRIPEGIMDMLSGFELPEAPALNMKMVYVIIDAFFLLMLLTVSFSLRRAWRQRKLPPKSRAYFIRNIFEVLLIHAALPVTLIVGIPYYFQATPPFFAINIPDFYAALVSISLILVTSGFIKLRRLFRRSSF